MSPSDSLESYLLGSPSNALLNPTLNLAQSASHVPLGVLAFQVPSPREEHLRVMEGRMSLLHGEGVERQDYETYRGRVLGDPEAKM